MFLGISFIPQLLVLAIIGGLIYFFRTKKIKISKIIPLSIIGAIIGLPLSYYFQPDMIRAKIGGISGYFKHFNQILEAEDLIGNVIISMVVFALIGGIIGYFMDKNAIQKSS